MHEQGCYIIVKCGPYTAGMPRGVCLTYFYVFCSQCVLLTVKPRLCKQSRSHEKLHMQALSLSLSIGEV